MKTTTRILIFFPSKTMNMFYLRILPVTLTRLQLCVKLLLVLVVLRWYNSGGGGYFSGNDSTVASTGMLSVTAFTHLQRQQYYSFVPYSAYSSPSLVAIFVPTRYLHQLSLENPRQHFPLFLSSNEGDSVSANSPKKKQVIPPKKAFTTRKTKSQSKSTKNNFGDKKQQQQQKQTWRVFGIEVHPDRLASIGDVVDKIQVQQQLEESSTTIEQKTDKLSENIVSTRSSRKEEELIESVHSAIMDAVEVRLKLRTNKDIKLSNVTIVRRSVDARPNKFRTDGGYGPRYVYVLDFNVNLVPLWKNQPGRLELLAAKTVEEEVMSLQTSIDDKLNSDAITKTKRVIIVGAGPAGLFCALQLVQQQRTNGIRIIPIILERGQPVEKRGRDIGALIHRIQMNNESNFAFGEGGAGTWSDGKLTTRIGRNSDPVRTVLQTFVTYGAPSSILINGSPHLGTDNLVRILRNMRYHLQQLGGEIHFGTKVTKLIIENGVTTGVEFVQSIDSTMNNNKQIYGKQQQQQQNSLFGVNKPAQKQSSSLVVDDNGYGTLYGDATVLATGHSARDMYEQLYKDGIQLQPKGFAVGYRIEHPQKIINKIQYGLEWASTVCSGKGSTDTINNNYVSSLLSQSSSASVLNNNSTVNGTINHENHVNVSHDSNLNDATTATASSQNKQQQKRHHTGTLPVPSYRLATDNAYDGEQNRGVYSFCMCPGGQIVPASTNPNEVCVNGMSFSRRDSIWANSALVVTVSVDDTILQPYIKQYGSILAGLYFQRDIERKASIMGGGNLTVPVQCVTDFINGTISTILPSSSYRLGIKSSPCHELYPYQLINSLRYALIEYFNKQMPGYICNDALLHGVETRTSSPVRIVRYNEDYYDSSTSTSNSTNNNKSYQAIGTQNLYPAGEGAGFAGGIVSAAVDGIMVGTAVITNLVGNGDSATVVGKGNDGTTTPVTKVSRKSNSVPSYY